MTILKNIRRSAPYELLQADSFRAEFGVVLEERPQAPGVCGDYRITSTSEATLPLEKAVGHSLLGHKVEFKNDKTSVDYKSFWVEYATLNKGVVKESGHVKAAREGCLVVITSGLAAPGREVYVFTGASLLNMVANHTRYKLKTKPGANGNPPGFFSLGKVVFLGDAKNCVDFRYTMS